MVADARGWTAGGAWSSPLVAVGGAVLLGLVLGAAAVLGSPAIALAGLVAAAVCLAVPREPAFGLQALAALAFLLPFAVIPVRLGGAPTALEAVLLLTLGATLLRALAGGERSRLEPAGWLLMGMLGLASLSFILSLPYTGELADVARKFLKLTLAMLVFPLTLHLVRDGRRVDGLLLTLMVCGGLEAIVAVGLYLAPRDVAIQLLSSLGSIGYPTGLDVIRFLAGENDTYTDIVRATGTSIDPNVLGGELMLAAALLVAQLVSPRPLLPRVLLMSLSAFAVVGMLLTHSRSSWVGLAAAFIVLATLRYRRLWLVILPAVLALAFLPAGRALYARVVSGFLAQDRAAAMRIDEYRNALEIVQHHPVVGIGFGAPPSIDLAPGASNIYLTVAETMGLPALVLYVTLLGWLLVRALRLLVSGLDPRMQSALASLMAAFIAALASGLFDHYFASTAFPHMVGIFWLTCGLLWRTTRLAEAHGPKTAAPAPGPPRALAAAVLQ